MGRKSEGASLVGGGGVEFILKGEMRGKRGRGKGEVLGVCVMKKNEVAIEILATARMKK